jgi:phosphatidate cytidylyltransferase
LSSLLLRILSAGVLLPLAIAAVYAGGYVFAGLVVLVAVLLAVEWDRLVTGNLAPVRAALFGLAVASGPVVAIWPGGTMQEVLIAGLIGIGLSFVLSLIYKINIILYCIGFIWFFVPCVSLVLVRETPAVGFLGTLWLLATVWICDTAAYAAGRLIGGVKLAPRISPNKTWAGLLGGVAGAALLGAIFGAVGSIGPVGALAATGALLAAVSQIGDLAESAVKRHFAVKDSGNLIPGHGGVFDRVDGILFAVPLAALIVFANDGALTLWQ